MEMRTRMMYMTVTVIVFLTAVVSVYSQEDVTTVEDSAFTEKMRPPVPFLHDKHNENALIHDDDCNICHHTYSDGKKLEDESSEDQECSACHQPADEKNHMELIKAYHNRCKGCHTTLKAGPVLCGECHVRTQ